jgi:hypothetical protein
MRGRVIGCQTLRAAHMEEVKLRHGRVRQAWATDGERDGARREVSRRDVWWARWPLRSDSPPPKLIWPG